jgi:hypothetical protein
MDVMVLFLFMKVKIKKQNIIAKKQKIDQNA